MKEFAVLVAIYLIGSRWIHRIERLYDWHRGRERDKVAQSETSHEL